MQTVLHWATRVAPPTAWRCGSSYWTHCVYQWGEKPSPPPGSTASTGATLRGLSPLSWIPILCRVAPSLRPPWHLYPSPPTYTLLNVSTRYLLLQLDSPQDTCWCQWGAPTSTPCRLPRLGFPCPYNTQTLQKSAWYPNLRPQTAAASVGGWPSHTLLDSPLPTIFIALRKPLSRQWFPLAQTTVVGLRMLRISLLSEVRRRGDSSVGHPEQTFLIWGRFPPAGKHRPFLCQWSTIRRRKAYHKAPICGRTYSSAPWSPPPLLMSRYWLQVCTVSSTRI